MDKICKEAITIHMYIDYVLKGEDEPPYYRVLTKRVDLVKRGTRKFLRDMKESKYGSKVRGGSGYTHHGVILHSLERDKDESNSMYLTWLQMQLHQFIHNFCQKYDPWDRDRKKAPFYTNILEYLIR